MIARIQAAYHRHQDFILLLILFITFRLLALAAFRPGGLVLDFSDFYWYRGFAELTRQGYYPYDNLWTTYPPLFPAVMIAIYEISALLPPWEHPNLWFTLLLGSFFLLFEIGNFILLYLFALEINKWRPTTDDRRPTTDKTPQESTSSISQSPNLPISSHQSPHLPISQSPISPSPLRPCWLYATLFVPVYTLTGWFESYPLFFFLLSLYLLLKNRPYLSAFFTGIGFMIKLIPLILMPVAVQIFSKTRLELRNKTLEIRKIPKPSSRTSQPQLPITNYQLPIPQSPSLPISLPFDIPRTLIYTAIFLITVIAIALPFYRMNPDLIFGPQQITGARQPWETVWALIDGNYEYGVIPLDMRDLTWTPGDAPPTRIPWLLVTAGAALIYAIFYSRPLDWRQPRNVLAFVGFTLCLFMLWSKGYSPQWLGWPLFFIALLLPNLRGVIYATVLSIGNIIEANFFFIIFPEETWLLTAIVLIRTFLLIVLAAEFLLLIWPQVVTPRVATVRAWGLAAFVALLLIGLIPAGLELGRSYFDLRLRQSPYAATINRLQGETVTGALLLNSHTTYDWFYPYLRHDYRLFMLDEYAPPGGSVAERTTALLDRIAAQTDVLWIYDADAATTTEAEQALTAWLGEQSPAHLQDIDGGRLYLFVLE